MVTKTTHNYGATTRITINGHADEVEREINRLSNAGMIASIPESYREGQDETVTVSSSKEKIARGLKFLASVETRRTMRRTNTRKLSTFRRLAKNSQDILASEFIREKQDRSERRGGGVFSQVFVPVTSFER